MQSCSELLTALSETLRSKRFALIVPCYITFLNCGNVQFQYHFVYARCVYRRWLVRNMWCSAQGVQSALCCACAIASYYCVYLRYTRSTVFTACSVMKLVHVCVLEATAHCTTIHFLLYMHVQAGVSTAAADT
jgi:hypothetical protein